jgi:hypothetical protein
MRKQDIPTTEIASTGEFSETALAVPTEQTDIMSTLLDQPVLTEIGLVQLKTLKGSSNFDGGAQGTLESPINAIIIESEPTRTLWAQGDEAVIKKVTEWSRRPICSSRNVWSSNNELLQTGWVKGSLGKELDEETPNQVRLHVDTIKDCNFSCSKCHYAEYESSVSGRGQACRSGYRLLLYIQSEDMICVLNITPSSLKRWREFNIGLQRKSPAMYVTEISTFPAETEGVNQYNLVDFKLHKENKVVQLTNGDMLASLSGRMMYAGKNMSLLEAYRLEFRRVELEIEDNGDAQF